MEANVLLSPAELFDRSLWYLPILFIVFAVIWLAILKFFRLDS